MEKDKKSSNSEEHKGTLKLCAMQFQNYLEEKVAFIDNKFRSEELIKYVMFCKKNMDQPIFQEIFKKYTKSKLGENCFSFFGLPKDFKKKDISSALLGINGDTQEYPLFYSDEFREGLMACTKYKLFKVDKEKCYPDYPSKKARKNNDYYMFEHFYSGIYKGQVVLFKEVVSYKVNDNEVDNSEKVLDENGDYLGYTQNEGHYELKAIINGKRKGLLELIRVDFNSQHDNLFDEFGQIASHTFPVRGSHVHYNNMLSQFVLPFRQNSVDAIEVDTHNLKFKDIVRGVRNALNMPIMDHLITSDNDLIVKETKECDALYENYPIQGRLIDRFRVELNRFRENESEIKFSQDNVLGGTREANKGMHDNGFGYDYDSFKNVGK